MLSVGAQFTDPTSFKAPGGSLKELMKLVLKWSSFHLYGVANCNQLTSVFQSILTYL